MTALFGMDVARTAWTIDDLDLAGLLPGEHSAATINDVRAQFAQWAANSPSRVFESLADAWNAFAAPKLGRPHPVVLLPASTCYRCANARALTGQRTDPSCVLCEGTGRRRPSAFPALIATSMSFVATEENQPATEASPDTAETETGSEARSVEASTSTNRA